MHVVIGELLLVLFISILHQYIASRCSTEDEDNQEIAEWHFAAMVVDRLCLVLMSLSTGELRGKVLHYIK